MKLLGIKTVGGVGIGEEERQQLLKSCAASQKTSDLNTAYTLFHLRVVRDPLNGRQVEGVVWRKNVMHEKAKPTQQGVFMILI